MYNIFQHHQQVPRSMADPWQGHIHQAKQQQQDLHQLGMD